MVESNEQPNDIASFLAEKGKYAIKKSNYSLKELNITSFNFFIALCPLVKSW